MGRRKHYYVDGHEKPAVRKYRILGYLEIAPITLIRVQLSIHKLFATCIEYRVTLVLEIDTTL
jgi:hypothetical protein